MVDLNVNEVAPQLHVEPRRVRELLQSGRLIGLKTGRKWVISQESVDAYLSLLQPKSTPSIGYSGLMQKHRYDLMSTLMDLREIGPFPFHDYDLATFYSRPHEPCWPFAKGQVSREENGDLVVQLDAEVRLSWSYLHEHLAEDSIWRLLVDWKAKTAGDIKARFTLLEAVILRIQENHAHKGLGWPVVIETGSAYLAKARELGKSVSLYYAFRLFDQVLSRSLDLRHGGYLARNFSDGSGTDEVTELGNDPVIYAADKSERSKAIEFFLNAQSELISLPAAQASVDAYSLAERATNDVKSALERLGLAVGFPPGSSCDGCREWVISSGRGIPSGS